jgi:hypothetical protein
MDIKSTAKTLNVFLEGKTCVFSSENAIFDMYPMGSFQSNTYLASIRSLRVLQIWYPQLIIPLHGGGIYIYIYNMPYTD